MLTPKRKGNEGSAYEEAHESRREARKEGDIPMKGKKKKSMLQDMMLRRIAAGQNP